MPAVSEKDKFSAHSTPDFAHSRLIHHFSLTCNVIGPREMVKCLLQMGRLTQFRSVRVGQHQQNVLVSRCDDFGQL